MALYQNSLIRKNDSVKTGNAASNYRVFVYNEDNTSLVNIYSDEDFQNFASNPVVADSEGFFQFYAPAGTYTLRIEKPAIKTIKIVIDEAGNIPVGVNLLSNSAISDSFIPRDGSTQLIADYPELAGTPGYPTDVTPAGIAFDSNYVSDEEISTTSTSLKGMCLDSTGRIFLTGTTQAGFDGSFLYSDDNGATENYAPNVNTAAKYAIACEGPYILAGGLSGNISVYNKTTYAYIDTKLAGSLNIHYIEYDSENSVYVAANRSGSVYVSSDPVVGWTLDGSISGVSGSSNYYEKTRDGYLIFNDSSNELLFTPSLVGSPTASLTISAQASNILFTKSSNNNSGKVLVATQSTLDKKFWTSTDGGQTFTEIFPTGFNTNNTADLVHIGNDVWVMMVAFSSTVQYTTDFGQTWQTVSYTPPAGATGGNRLYINQSGDVIASFSGDLTVRSLFLSQTIPPTTFTVSQLDSPNSTDTYYVKAK